VEVIGKRIDKELPDNPGEFCFSDDEPPTMLTFCCPCGCGDVGGIGLPGNKHGPEWTWNGDKEKPTCTPSVRFIGGCKWHGFLTNGIWSGNNE